MITLITGSAGFIGSSLALSLLNRGDTVIGLDNHNDYYDPKIKEARINRFIKNPNYKHFRINLNDRKAIDEIFYTNKPRRVVNLAAQAGVRHSINNPLAFIDTNVVGFANLLEACRHNKIDHLVYASTSSIYGGNTKMPFSEHDSANHPLSIYAATKKSNELMAHVYSFLFKLPTTGLRFFTVYGPWGRPDMALFKFTKAILEENTIDVYNHGNHTRDFTYIDDIVDGIIKTLDNPAKENTNWKSDNPDNASSNSPWRIYNIGNNKKIHLMSYIKELEKTLGKKAKINYLPLQEGDVPDTLASIECLQKQFNYKPSTSISDGIYEFVNWYKNYFKI